MQIDIDGYEVEELRLAETPAQFLEAMVFAKSYRRNHDGTVFMVARLKQVAKRAKPGWDETKIVRDDIGRFANKNLQQDAVGDPTKAAELFAKVTRPAEREKLISNLREAGGMSQSKIEAAIKAADSMPKADIPKKDPPKASGAPGSKPASSAGSLAEKLNSQGGFTYQPITGVSPEKGFSIAMFPEEEKILSASEVTTDSLLDYIEERQEKFGDERIHFGAWHNKKTDDNPDGDDNVYLDMSMVVDDKDEAVKLAKEHGQLGIYDLAGGQTIQTMTPDERKQWEQSKGKGSAGEAQGPETPKVKAKQAAMDTMAQDARWQAWDKQAVDISQMDKATRKATLAKMKKPPELINEPSLYFNMESSHMTVDPQILDHEKEFEPASMDNATKMMALAALGKNGKRNPVDVAMRNGQLVVVDGNATTNASRANGLHVPVRLVESDPSQWFSDAETKKPDSPKSHSAQKSYEEHLKAAQENMDDSEDSFKAVLDLGKGLTDSIGADVPSYEEALARAAKGDKKPMVIFGPIKTAESAGRKVRDKYKGDFSRLTDVVRATVVVGSYGEVGPAMAAMKKEAEQRGWKVVPNSGENKFLKPTDAGYRDVSLSLVAPNGQVAEMQVNTTAMWSAKESKGHKLYEDWRKIALKEGGPSTDQERQQEEQLRLAQVKLYEDAWKNSQ